MTGVCVSAGDHAEEKQAWVGRRQRGGPVTAPRPAHPRPVSRCAGHHAQEARQGAAAEHGAGAGGRRRAARAPGRAAGAARAPRAARAAARLLNLAERAPHLAPRRLGLKARAARALAASHSPHPHATCKYHRNTYILLIKK